MKDRSQNSPRFDPLAHAPSVAICPPARCFYRDQSSPGVPCGELARWERTGNHWFATEYFCERQHPPADIEIPPIHAFRRARLSCDVFLSGVHVNAPLAHTEAIVRLERALKAIGAIPDIVTVGSTLVKSSGLPLPVPRAPAWVDPE